MNIFDKDERTQRRLRTLSRGLMALLVLVLGLCASVSSASAQVTFDGCRDIRGFPVASVLDLSIRDVAMASIARDGSPIIRYNPQVLSWFQPQTRLWWYGHECGHHALGHNFGTTHPLAVEQAADCYGIRTLADSGMLSKRDLRVIQADLNRLGRGDWMHLPGPVRAVNLERCLDDSGSSRSIRPCRHPRHPGGDIVPCQHPLHPRGDIYTCQHVCHSNWGPVPCHPSGDVGPCNHAAHPRGDLTPCEHQAHPGGH